MRSERSGATPSIPAPAADLPHACARQALRLVPRLHRWATARVIEQRAGQDLSLRQFAALYAMREGARSPGALARRLRVTPAVVTGLIDRLERRGYVRRGPDPEDRRRLRLEATEAGRAASLAVERGLEDELAAKLRAGSPIALEELGRALGLLERVLGALEAETGVEVSSQENPRRGKDVH